MADLPHAPAPGRIPTPGQLGPAPFPTQPSRSDDPRRTHCLDTGVGIAFAHAGRLDLIIAFLAGRLVAVEDVAMEVDYRATEQLRPGHQPIDRYVRDACRQVKTRLLTQDIPTVEVPPALSTRVEVLIQRMRTLDPTSKPGKHTGEAVTIAYAESRRPTAVILTNDGAAQRVAEECSVRWHSSASLLRLMATAGLVTADEAFAMFAVMDAVSGIAGPRPGDAAWFTA